MNSWNHLLHIEVGLGCELLDVISEGCKGEQEENLVGTARCLFLLGSNLNEERTQVQRMNQIDPNKRAVRRITDKCLLGMLYSNKDTQCKD